MFHSSASSSSRSRRSSSGLNWLAAYDWPTFSRIVRIFSSALGAVCVAGEYGAPVPVAMKDSTPGSQLSALSQERRMGGSGICAHTCGMPKMDSACANSMVDA